METHESKIILLYLEKLELLNQKEREVILRSIEWLNTSVIITNPTLN